MILWILHLSLQFGKQWFALWPYFFIRPKRSIDFFPQFFQLFTFVRMEWQLLSSLHARLEAKSKAISLYLKFLVVFWALQIQSWISCPMLVSESLGKATPILTYHQHYQASQNIHNPLHMFKFFFKTYSHWISARYPFAFFSRRQFHVFGASCVIVYILWYNFCVLTILIFLRVLWNSVTLFGEFFFFNFREIHFVKEIILKEVIAK